MDSNTSLPPPEQYRSLVKRLQSSNYLLNKQLQHICLVNGLRTSGVKAELQRRILDGKLALPVYPVPLCNSCRFWLGTTYQLGLCIVLQRGSRKDG